MRPLIRATPGTARLPHRGVQVLVAAATLALAVAGCASVEISQPTAPQAQALPDDAVDRSAHWRFDASRAPAERDGYRPPNKLAVLLPLSGSLATASAPVRDGLLAGYYGEQRRRPEIVFLDTTGTAAGAVAAYRRAVAEGADQVLGPLGRDEVGALFREVESTVPVIALNRASAAPPLNNASFSLAPEDDGIGAADYLVSANARRILLLANGDETARRSVSAFIKRLEARGGVVAGTVAVSGDDPGDLVPALQAVAQQAGGVDGVFLALEAAQARSVAPQLLAAGLGGKPRVATSQLASAGSSAERNRVLDGIVFPTERWMAGGLSTLPSAASVAGRLPTARGPAARLFAFGYDAWQLVGYLEHLAVNGEASIAGATGVLRLDADGNVLRTPAWSTFGNGVAMPLPGAGG